MTDALAIAGGFLANVALLATNDDAALALVIFKDVAAQAEARIAAYGLDPIAFDKEDAK